MGRIQQQYSNARVTPTGLTTSKQNTQNLYKGQCRSQSCNPGVDDLAPVLAHGRLAQLVVFYNSFLESCFQRIEIYVGLQQQARKTGTLPTQFGKIYSTVFFLNFDCDLEESRNLEESNEQLGGLWP